MQLLLKYIFAVWVILFLRRQYAQSIGIRSLKLLAVKWIELRPIIKCFFFSWRYSDIWPHISWPIQRRCVICQLLPYPAVNQNRLEVLLCAGSLEAEILPRRLRHQLLPEPAGNSQTHGETSRQTTAQERIIQLSLR